MILVDCYTRESLDRPLASRTGTSRIAVSLGVRCADTLERAEPGQNHEPEQRLPRVGSMRATNSVKEKQSRRTFWVWSSTEEAPQARGELTVPRSIPPPRLRGGSCTYCRHPRGS